LSKNAEKSAPTIIPTTTPAKKERDKVNQKKDLRGKKKAGSKAATSTRAGEYREAGRGESMI